MSFQQWIAAVLAIAESRGIEVQTTYPANGWVTFNWRCRNGTGYGSCGAGADLIGLTTPDAFTWLWKCTNPAAPPPPAPEVVSAQPWERHGKFVPRVPAMATAEALKVLFGL